MVKDNRGGRRGTTEGLKPSDILRTGNIHVDTKLDEKTRSEVNAVLKDFRDKYGLETNNTRIADLKPNKPVLAYYDYSGIAINSKYLNSDKMNKAVDECVKTGFHPPRGNKSGLESVVAHELGHHVNDVIANRLGVSLDKCASDIVTQARKKTGDKGNVIFGGKISGYAKTSNAETVAEAMADVYCNGSKAKKQSRAIVNIIDSYF